MKFYLHQLKKRLIVGCGFDVPIQCCENIPFEKVTPIIDQEMMNQFVIILSNIQAEILELMQIDADWWNYHWRIYFTNRWIQRGDAQINDDRKKLLIQLGVSGLIEQQS